MTTSASSSTQTLSPQLMALLNGSGKSSAAAAAGSAAAGSTSGTSAKAIQDEFLTLLTTQLKNQDPMNPMDSSQMTSQLAQISTVSGIQQLDSTLQTMMSSNAALETAQSAALIGRNVLGPGSGFALPASGGTTLGVSLVSPADTVTATIKDSQGRVVRTFDLGAQSDTVATVAWDGKDAQGATLPAGNYALTVQAALKGAQVTATPLVQGTVTSVTSGASGIDLQVAGVGSIALGTVARID